MKKKGLQFDELRREAEKLLELLREPEPGYATWNEFLAERLRALKALIIAAGL